MRVLLLGDASNYHRTLATGLRELGHDVIVASDGSRWMHTERDLDLQRLPGRLGGALLYSRMLTTLRRRLSGYDVVQLVSPHFVQLKPHRLRHLQHMLRRQNTHLCLTALGTDTLYIEGCLRPRSPLRYSEFAIDGTPTPYSSSPQAQLQAWLTPEMHDYCLGTYRSADAIVSALYEYQVVYAKELADRKIHYAGIPIDTQALQPSAELRPDGRPLRIALAMHSHRMVEKGTDCLLPMLRSLADANPRRVHLEVLQDLPFDRFVERLQQADIVVDQLYSYTPATTALMAMALGKTVVSGAEPEFYDFIGESELRPIINANPLDINDTRQQIEALVSAPEHLIDLGRQSRLFVERHNDKRIVAQRFIDAWREIPTSRTL